MTSLVKQKCKDCQYLIILKDGKHVICDPPMEECPIKVTNGGD